MNEIFLSLIEFSSWPIFIFAACFLFRNELKDFFSRFAGIKAGQIEIQMREQLHAQNLSKEQLKKISGISADELDLFLLVSYTEAIGFNYTIPLPRHIFEQRLIQLESLGLLIVNIPEDPDERILHECTPEGRRVRELIMNASSHLLRNAA